MEFFGAIVAASGDAPLDKDQWIEACDSDQRLVRGKPVLRRNPFRPSELISVKLPDDIVAVVLEERTIGVLAWTVDDTPEIHVRGEDPAIIPIAQELAARLKAIFVEAVD